MTDEKFCLLKQKKSMKKVVLMDGRAKVSGGLARYGQGQSMLTGDIKCLRTISVACQTCSETFYYLKL